MVSPDVVGIGSEYFVVYFRVYIYVRPVYHYIAATVVYLAQRIITACVVERQLATFLSNPTPNFGHLAVSTMGESYI